MITLLIGLILGFVGGSIYQRVQNRKKRGTISIRRGYQPKDGTDPDKIRPPKGESAAKPPDNRKR